MSDIMSIIIIVLAALFGTWLIISVRGSALYYYWCYDKVPNGEYLKTIYPYLQPLHPLELKLWEFNLKIFKLPQHFYRFLF